jgi:Fur family ferric uptake transcriptional regulator
MTDIGSTSVPVAWATVRDRLHERGLRWTPQRRTLIEVLSRTDGHVTGSELVDRCRDLDPTTIPSTVYRTLDVLEELGLVSHSHSAEGREEFHVMPSDEHGHLQCIGCGETWEIDAAAAASLVRAVAAARRFSVDLSHLSIAGRCANCAAKVDLTAGPRTNGL